MPPEPWAYGNASPYSKFGPGFGDWDVSVMKRFRLPISAMEVMKNEPPNIFEKGNRGGADGVNGTLAATDRHSAIRNVAIWGFSSQQRNPTRDGINYHSFP
jgi:hypothetical protein